MATNAREAVKSYLRPDLMEQIEAGSVSKQCVKDLIENYRIEGEAAIESGTELLKIARELEKKIEHKDN